MTEHPIPLNPWEVRAILDGRKTMTRRPTIHEVPHPPADTIHARNIGGNLVAGPYLDAYCDQPKTPENPRGAGPFWCWWTRDHRCGQMFCPARWIIGDTLWVRETWQYYDWTEDGQPFIRYAADDATQMRTPPEDWSMRVEAEWIKLSNPGGPARDKKWRPSTHMPRWASRIILRVTGVRVERLWDITGDARRCGGGRQHRRVRRLVARAIRPRRLGRGLVGLGDRV